jgi:hypothetical protein
VPVQRETGDGGEAGRDRRVPCDHAAAVQALGEDDVIDLLRVESLGGGPDNVVGQVERGGVAQRPSARGPDRGAQRGYQYSLGHE